MTIHQHKPDSIDLTAVPSPSQANARRRRLSTAWVADAAGPLARFSARGVRAGLGTRDGIAALALALVLLFVIVEIAHLRQASARTLTVGLSAFIALQLVLVVSTAALTADGVNPLTSRFNVATTAVDRATAEALNVIAVLENLAADYGAALDEITTARHEAVHHLHVITGHALATIELYTEGIREGSAEPSHEPLFGADEPPTNEAPKDAIALVELGWTNNAEELPDALDHNEVVAAILSILTPPPEVGPTRSPSPAASTDDADAADTAADNTAATAATDDADDADGEETR